MKSSDVRNIFGVDAWAMLFAAEGCGMHTRVGPTVAAGEDIQLVTYIGRLTWTAQMRETYNFSL